MHQLSIVIPARDEAASIAVLVNEIFLVLRGRVPNFEVIVVDDGSTDRTADVLAYLMTREPDLRVVRHPISAGQSAAIHSGVLAARTSIICTLDGDGQNPPADLVQLYEALVADPRVGLAAGQRRIRKDGLSKRLASLMANRIRRFVLADNTRDTGCGLKAFRRESFLALPYFNHMHRYLPALFARDGWQVALVDVDHRTRAAGKSKYGNLQRGLVGAVDLLGVAWLIRRRKKIPPAMAALGQTGAR